MTFKKRKKYNGQKKERKMYNTNITQSSYKCIVFLKIKNCYIYDVSRSKQRSTKHSCPMTVNKKRYNPHLCDFTCFLRFVWHHFSPNEE